MPLPPEGAESDPCNASPDECSRATAIIKTSREYDPVAFYPKIRVPTLLVFAIGSGPDPEVLEELKKRGIDFFEEVRKKRQQAIELAERNLQHSRSIFIENTSHRVQIDQPKLLAEAIKQFLMAQPKTP